MAELDPAFGFNTRAKKWKYKFKLIFHLLEWGSNPQPVGFAVTPRAAAPRPASINYYVINKLIYIFYGKYMLIYYMMLYGR